MDSNSMTIPTPCSGRNAYLEPEVLSQDPIKLGDVLRNQSKRGHPGKLRHMLFGIVQAMLGALGMVVPELLDGTDHVAWFEAGAKIFDKQGIQYLGVPGLINAKNIVATLIVQVRDPQTASRSSLE